MTNDAADVENAVGSMQSMDPKNYAQSEIEVARRPVLVAVLLLDGFFELNIICFIIELDRDILRGLRRLGGLILTEEIRNNRGPLLPRLRLHLRVERFDRRGTEPFEPFRTIRTIRILSK